MCSPLCQPRGWFSRWEWTCTGPSDSTLGVAVLEPPGELQCYASNEKQRGSVFKKNLWKTKPQHTLSKGLMCCQFSINISKDLVDYFSKEMKTTMIYITY